jgi:hypothetical protein
MKTIFQIISFIALAGTLLPSVIYCAGGMPLDIVKWIMLLSTIVWFVFTPLWMNKKA